MVPDVNGGVDGVVVGRHGLFQSGVAEVVGGPDVNIKKIFFSRKKDFQGLSNICNQNVRLVFTNFLRLSLRKERVFTTKSNFARP